MRFKLAPTVMVAMSSIGASLTVDPNDHQSLLSAANTIGTNLRNNVGSLQAWWMTGTYWDTMIHWAFATGISDQAYKDSIFNAINAEAYTGGNTNPDFNTGLSMGNDDTLMWVLAAMTGYEIDFGGHGAKFQAIVDYNWNVMHNDRWDTKTCGGGLHFQIQSSSSSYTYKQSIANGQYFQLSARMCLKENNSKYCAEANTVWKWMISVGFITSDWTVIDGAAYDASNQCNKITSDRYSYNHGVVLFGAAMMKLATGNQAAGGGGSLLWSDAVTKLMGTASYFFKDSGGPVLYEAACEDSVLSTGGPACAGTSGHEDRWYFKALLARWMIDASKVDGDIVGGVKGFMQNSAKEAGLSCDNTGACGAQWYNGKDNGQMPWQAQSMAALEVIGGLLKLV